MHDQEAEVQFFCPERNCFLYLDAKDLMQHFSCLCFAHSYIKHRPRLLRSENEAIVL